MKSSFKKFLIFSERQEERVYIRERDASQRLDPLRIPALDGALYG